MRETVMDKTLIDQLGDELYQAMAQRETVSPLTSRGFDISVEDAYHISLRMLERRLAAGERVIGKKIGVTSKAVQNMLGVHQPDFGYLTDAWSTTAARPCRSARS
ncbi:4-oxalocrotonate decarboxylase [Pseudomonas sp. BAY1663]|nr:4-oxalocrotonate decarboxylase [Pseudomonas sp. BAY1663]